MLPTPFQLTSPQHRNIRSLTQDIEPFLNNIISKYTNPLPLETEAHSIHTYPLVRERLDSYLYYIRYKTLDINASQNPFKIILTLFKSIIPEHIIEQLIHKVFQFHLKMFLLHT